jgi:hypothetical protein
LLRPQGSCENPKRCMPKPPGHARALLGGVILLWKEKIRSESAELFYSRESFYTNCETWFFGNARNFIRSTTRKYCNDAGKTRKTMELQKSLQMHKNISVFIGAIPGVGCLDPPHTPSLRAGNWPEKTTWPRLHWCDSGSGMSWPTAHSIPSPRKLTDRKNYWLTNA